MSRLRGSSWVTSRSPMWIAPVACLLDPRDQLQQRRLAAAGRADQHHELAVADLEADVVDGVRAAALVGLADSIDAAAHVVGLLSRDALAAVHQYPPHFQAVVEHDHVGRRARHEPPEVRPLRDPRRAPRLPPAARPPGPRRAPAGCARPRSSSAPSPRAAPRARARRRPRPRCRRPPSTNSPSPMPAAGAASVTSAKREAPRARPPAPCPGATWCRSTITCTTTSGRASADIAMLGSRAVLGRIALNRCVTVRTPRSNARCASAAVASVWPAETVMPRPTSSSISSNAPGSSGASVTWRHRRGVQQPAQQREIRRREPARVVHAGAPRREERPLDVGAEDARADAPAGIARSASSSAASGAVTNVGWNAVVPVASSASPTRT